MVIVWKVHLLMRLLENLVRFKRELKEKERGMKEV